LAEVRLDGITANVRAVDIGKVGTAEQRRIVSVLTRLGSRQERQERAAIYSNGTMFGPAAESHRR
jgi:hypothetical protein